MDLVIIIPNWYFRFTLQCVAETAVPSLSSGFFQGNHSSVFPGASPIRVMILQAGKGLVCGANALDRCSGAPDALEVTISALCSEAGSQELLLPCALLGSYRVTCRHSTSSRRSEEPCRPRLWQSRGLEQEHAHRLLHPADAGPVSRQDMTVCQTLQPRDVLPLCIRPSTRAQRSGP